MKRQDRLKRREENGRLAEQLTNVNGRDKGPILEILRARTPSKQPFNLGRRK